MCMYKDLEDGHCRFRSCAAVTEYCVEGPCVDEVLTNADRSGPWTTRGWRNFFPTLGQPLPEHGRKNTERHCTGSSSQRRRMAMKYSEQLEQWERESYDGSYGSDWLEEVGEGIKFYAMLCEAKSIRPTFAGLMKYLKSLRCL